MRNFTLILLGFTLLANPALAQKRIEGIAAVVNNRAITMSDLDDRLSMTMSSAGLPNTKDVLARVRPQILSALVEEQIKVQEADRLKLKIDEAEVDNAISEVAKQNKMSADDFKTMFKKRGLPIRSLRDQIRTQIAWMKVVNKQIRPQIEVSESDIDAELKILQDKVGQDEFLLNEIVLPIDRPQDEKNAQELAQRLVTQIQKNPASFPALAQQFSRAAGAAQGGDMGWVATDQAPADITEELNTAKAGTLIGPFKSPSGLHLILVRDRRARVPENLPNRDMVANKIGLERLDRLQRRYYLDLRSSSFVENRL